MVSASCRTTTCNAPWVSTVIETDGMVRPCFFHRSFGNIYEQPLESIVNSPEMISFRKNLDVQQDPTCRACVCTLAPRPPRASLRRQMSDRRQVAVLGWAVSARLWPAS